MYHNKVVKSVDAQARFDITPRLNTIEYICLGNDHIFHNFTQPAVPDPASSLLS
ncbi:hypothetical protein Mal52_30290 [Symmachiella dynata]|uniref:Uncharacterized protein n=1 Tax=Symmachiella dynata TaxID=2527995 RepID=A0A517ZPX8_9PLAN|nr:hypothetical protein Mal52_30290 [Symmachiella dynata]